MSLVTTLSVVTNTPRDLKTSVLPKIWDFTAKASGKVTFLGVQFRYFVFLVLTCRPSFVDAICNLLNAFVKALGFLSTIHISSVNAKSWCCLVKIVPPGGFEFEFEFEFIYIP
jgi:hypothetical protein